MALIKYKKVSIFFVLILLVGFYIKKQLDNILYFSKNEIIDKINPADCGVVLTGSAGRVREGFEILNLKKINKLIVSGVYKEAKINELFPHLPYYVNIDVKDVYLEKDSTSTVENAKQSLLLIKKLNCQNVLLITSNLHMFRAFHIFKKHFPKDYPISAYAVYSANKSDGVFDIGLELVKTLFYGISL